MKSGQGLEKLLIFFKKFCMSYDEEELDGSFKINTEDEELGEPLDIPEGMNDFGLDEEDPDRDG